MRRPSKIPKLWLALLALPLLGALPPPPVVTGLASFALVVSNLDTALKFYHDGLGLEIVTLPTSVTDPAFDQVMNTPAARLRYARLRVPNEPYAIELDEFSGIPATVTEINHNDPGSSFLNFGFLDVAPVFDRLRAANTVAIAKSGLPRGEKPGQLSGAWVRDPDGHLLELMQGGWDADRKSLVGVTGAYRGHFGMTMWSHLQALAFYRDLLGFDLQDGFPPMVGPGQYMQAGPILSAMLGVPAQAEFAGVHGHCASAHCEMFDFKNAPRTEFDPPLQDPGASYLSVWVSNLDRLLPRLKAAQIAIVTTGGVPVLVNLPTPTWVLQAGELPPIKITQSRELLVRDPSGFPILLMQPVTGP